MNEIVTDGWRSGGAWLLPGKSTADRIQLLKQIHRQLFRQKKLRHITQRQLAHIIDNVRDMDNGLDECLHSMHAGQNKIKREKNANRRHTGGHLKLFAAMTRYVEHWSRDQTSVES